MSVLRIILFAGLWCPAFLFAHHNVEETIRNLTVQIAESPTAELYFKRAIEYRALRKPKESAADLRSALQLSPDHYSSKMALARLLMSMGKYEESRTLAVDLVSSVKAPSQKIESLFLTAELAHARGKNDEALEVLNRLQKDFPAHDESIDLFHATLLIRINQASRAAELLQTCYRRSKGVVVRNSWIDASLMSGEFENVWPVIEKELNESRFKAAWLIRRAQVARLQDQDERMAKDLKQALLELKSRIRPDKPDLTLVADRGLARALNGDRKLAKSDLDLLRKSGFPAPSYVYLEKLLEE